jgi:hypothetical protein
VIRVAWSETELRDLLAEYLPTLPRHPSAEEFMGAPVPSRQAAAKAISATTAPSPMSNADGGQHRAGPLTGARAGGDALGAGAAVVKERVINGSR